MLYVPVAWTLVRDIAHWVGDLKSTGCRSSWCKDIERHSRLRLMILHKFCLTPEKPGNPWYYSVIPAKAGIQKSVVDDECLDPRLRGGDVFLQG